MSCCVGFDGSPLVLDRNRCIVRSGWDDVRWMDMLKGIECNFACSTGDVVINS